jgi:hypothetical protein
MSNSNSKKRYKDLSGVLVTHAYIIPATWEAEIRSIMVQGQPGQIVHKPSSQNNQSKMDWRCGSSSRVPALQVQTPVPPKTKTKKLLR